MMRRLLVAALLAGCTPAFALPDFVPEPGDVYEGYVALEMPRAEVPVGALRVQDYGPSGAGAAADNLVTERSLSQVRSAASFNSGSPQGSSTSSALIPRFAIDCRHASATSA
jgi:hypothetical protein